MKIILWIGNESNQRALANKIHNRYPLTAIVTESRKHKRKLTIKKIFEKGIEKIFLRNIAFSWFKMMDYYKNQYPIYPNVPILDVENINNDKVFDYTNEKQPDLIIVSGTRMIRKKLLSIKPNIGILNLHTGLSPYIKGGPNCTNWCISKKKFHLIGNTIMWIDEGIDSGNILATEFTNFNGFETLLKIHIKVMEHAHELYIRSIENIKNGYINNIAQKDIDNGITYYNKDWGLKEKFQLLVNLKEFKEFFKYNKLVVPRKNIKVFPVNKTTI
ncbi:MAG: formyltransferase family protein [Bacteroidia bacterium]